MKETAREASRFRVYSESARNRSRPPRGRVSAVDFGLSYGVRRGKVDEIVLALLYPVTFRDGPVVRAWKGFDWGTMDRLYENGLIHDPKRKARSVILAEEGEWTTREFFERHFGR